jgi:hypothetical protein
MAPKPTNQLRQVYEIRGGMIDIKIVTETGLSAEEMAEFGKVVTAVEGYAAAHPPESPEVRAERLAARARSEEFN